MDKYRGIVTSDYSAYSRFDAGDRHQLCWAHELRVLLYASQRRGARCLQAYCTVRCWNCTAVPLMQ